MIKHRIQTVRASLLAATSLTAAAAMALFHTGSAYGQTEPISDLEAARGDGAFGGQDTIVVTGVRFQNSLVNRLPIPSEELAVTLDELQQDDLERLGFINPQEALATLPNVAFTGKETSDGSVGLNIRGFRPSFLINNQAVPNNRGYAIDQSFLDRYEVLKGPTSIVFGPVRPGGVINQVLRTPLDDDAYQLEIIASTYGGHRIEADLNDGALVGQDWLKGRITIAYENIGTSPQAPVEREVFAIRPVIEADFTDRTRLQASVSYRDVVGINASQFPLNEDGTIPDEVDIDSFFGATSPLRNEQLFAEGQVVHEFLDNLKLTVRGSYLDIETDNQYASGFYGDYSVYGGEYLNGITIDNRVGDTIAFRSISEAKQEYVDAQLAGFFSLFGERQDWVIGATLSNLENITGFGTGEGETGFFNTVDLNDPSTWRAEFAYDDIDRSNFFLVRDELRSIYGEIYLRPTAWMTIPFGIRYDELDQTSRQLLDSGGGEGEANESDTTIRTGVNVRVLDGLNVFYSYAESFAPQFGIGRDGPLAPEKANNHEVGVKASLFDDRFSLNAAIFQTVRRNLEFPDPTRLPSEPFFALAEGEVESKGFEVATTFRATPTLSVSANFGYVEAEITEAIGGDLGRLQDVPNHNGAISVNWQPDGTLDGLRLGGVYRFQGDLPLYNRPANASPSFIVYEAEGYGVLDVYAGYAITENYDVQVNVQNVTDERYLGNFGFNRLGGGFRFGDPINALIKVTGRL
ncbi:MAG: TonB-dependent receptor [Pseudomonadota bacterium]